MQFAGAAPESAAKLKRGATKGPLVRATNSASFTDPTGDGSVDVTFVNVANDNQPNVHFEINFGTPIDKSTDAIQIRLDTDSNPATGGGSAGAKYFIEADSAQHDSASTSGTDRISTRLRRRRW